MYFSSVGKPADVWGWTPEGELRQSFKETVRNVFDMILNMLLLESKEVYLLYKVLMHFSQSIKNKKYCNFVKNKKS